MISSSPHRTKIALTSIVICTTGYCALSHGTVSGVAFLALQVLSSKVLHPCEIPLTKVSCFVRNKVFKSEITKNNVESHVIFVKTISVVTSCALSYFANAPLIELGQKALTFIVTHTPKALDLSGLFPQAPIGGIIVMSTVAITISIFAAAILIHRRNPHLRTLGLPAFWRDRGL